MERTRTKRLSPSCSVTNPHLGRSGDLPSFTHFHPCACTTLGSVLYINFLRVTALKLMSALRSLSMQRQLLHLLTEFNCTSLDTFFSGCRVEFRKLGLADCLLLKRALKSSSPTAFLF